MADILGVSLVLLVLLIVGLLVKHLFFTGKLKSVEDRHVVVRRETFQKYN